MDHPYKTAPDRAFWKRAVTSGCNLNDLSGQTELLIRKGDKVASAGSCFAANIVPFLEKAGFSYIRKGRIPQIFGSLSEDNFSYSKFSASYGNIYTVRQATQLLARALGRFKPVEDRWVLKGDKIIDPFRPGMRFPASNQVEFDLLLQQHLSNVIQVFQEADVFVFTLGLTEAWISRSDGAVFPACPGTIAGSFDPTRHEFHNFSVAEISQDIDEFIEMAIELNSRLRFILTVSPVPLVATATANHVLLASTYSKAVLRVVAQEATERHRNVSYFPAYEIVTGPQAPHSFFEPDRREPSGKAIRAVMRAFLSDCETDYKIEPDQQEEQSVAAPTPLAITESSGPDSAMQALSTKIANALCEEAAAEL